MNKNKLFEDIKNKLTNIKTCQSMLAKTPENKEHFESVLQGFFNCVDVLYFRHELINEEQYRQLEDIYREIMGG